MGDCVIIKFGGGLITNKAKMCTPDLLIIQSLVDVVADCIATGIKVIIVHGAGSYGHLRAKHWKLNEGNLPNYNFTPQDDCNSQKQAIKLVRKEMLTLNSLIVEAFDKKGIKTLVKPPHQWAINTGSSFLGNISEQFHVVDSDVLITFGDVVNCDVGEFGILSGDDLVVRLCQEIPNVKRLVFAIRGVDGILKKPPALATREDLIEKWSPEVQFSGVHNADIDVTGGIGLKARRGAEVASGGVKVFIINGEYPQRIFDACIGLPTIGTEIVA